MVNPRACPLHKLHTLYSKLAVPTPPKPTRDRAFESGAGVASLIARELRASGATYYDSLQCIALSPPPSISPAAAAACSPYVTSVTVEDDVVSRLSWRSLQLLRARALEALLLCRQPKWQVGLLNPAPVFRGV